MAKINHLDLGEVTATRYLDGVIKKVYPTDDTCDLTINGVEYPKVAVFYHCEKNPEVRSNGALYGAAAAFSVGDAVIVQTRTLQNGTVAPLFVIGFKEGLKDCGCFGVSGLVPVEGASWRNIDMSFGGADMYSYLKYDHEAAWGETDPYAEAGLMERAADRPIYDYTTILPVSCHPLLSFTSGLDFVQMDIAPGILVDTSNEWKYVFMSLAYRIAPQEANKAYLVTGILSHEYHITMHAPGGDDQSLVIVEIFADPAGGEFLLHEYGHQIGSSENVHCGSFIRENLSFCMLNYLDYTWLWGGGYSAVMAPPAAKVVSFNFYFDHEHSGAGFIRCDKPSFMRISNLKVIEVSMDFHNPEHPINAAMFEAAAGVPWSEHTRDYYCDK